MRVDVLLVCSTGGHLVQLLALREAWDGLERAWVTFDKTDARSLLAGERVFYAAGPTNRNFGTLAARNHLQNARSAWRLIRELRPAAILTTGAGLAVPYAWVGKALGARVVYVESFTRIDGPSLSLRLIAPVADRIYAQWPELTRAVRGARYAGNVFVPR